MASNITVDTLTKGSTTLNTDEIVDTNSSQVCKAWVNFNGQGTVAIRDSHNVSSITDNGVGDYTVNFSTAMPDSNYSASASASDPNFNQYSPLVFFLDSGYTTTGTRVNNLQMNNGDSHYDSFILTVQVFSN
jgi:hypothetical protein